MPDLRDMQLLAALARHAHFARAADECGISQPAFSARIRNLEIDLGVPVVKRGNRFMGFTAEGEIALKWARRLLGTPTACARRSRRRGARCSGRLAVGVVPTALAFVAGIPAPAARDASRPRDPALLTDLVADQPGAGGLLARRRRHLPRPAARRRP